MNLKDFFIWTLVGEANYSSTRKALDQYIPIFQEKNMHYIPKYSYCDHKEEIIKKTENHIEMTSQFITNKEPQHFLEIDEVFSSTSQYFLNKNAFLSTIQMLGSSDQVKRWEDLVINGRIIGAYAQTEMGHGSDVQKLETRADFDEKLGCFLFNSPKISSTKLWAGLLGTIATHCTIQAQTYIKGKFVGLQTFILQVRDIKTYAPMPGVVVGDQGPKLGFLGVDNGFMNLTNVRVPIENFLMKYSKITSNGIFIPPKNKDAAKFGYGSMLNLRVRLVKGFANFLMASSGVAFTQSSKDFLSPYLSENYKDLYLLKSFAYGYGILLTSCKLTEIFIQYSNELSSDNPNIKNTLNEIHVLSSSFKAFCGWKAVQFARESISLSPISFLKMSGLPLIYGNNVPFVTYEGDNSVLTQQTARFLLKELQKLQNENPKLNHCTLFFKHCFDNPLSDFLMKTKEDFLDLTKLEKLFEYLGFFNSKLVAEEFASVLMQGIPSKTAWNEKKLVDLINSSLVFISVINFKFSKEILNKMQPKLEPSLYKTFVALITFLGLEMIEEFGNKLLFFNLVSNNYRQIIYDLKIAIASELKKNIPEFISLLKTNKEFYYKNNLINTEDFSEKYKECFNDFAENARKLSKELNMDSKL